MKKVLLFLIVFHLSSAIHAQTFCYQQTMKVEKETGVKSKGSNNYSYITFQNNKSSCYFSNADGTTTSESSGYVSYFGMSTGERYEGRNYYVYKGEENGLHVYMAEETTYSYINPNYYSGERGGYYPMSKRRVYLYFNTSYDRMNEWSDPKTYLVESSSSDSPILKAARAGTAMGASAGQSISGGSTTYIFVYEKRNSPSDSSKNPTIFY